MQKKIGVYGGTFDPIHLGHINLALEMLEKRGLDEVWFCPAAINPFKQFEESTPANHRLEMVNRAIASIPQFKVIPNEIEKKTVSYTVDTLRTLTSERKDCHFFLILGEDAVPGFFRWKEPEEIIRLSTLLVGSRFSQNPLNFSEENPEIHKAIISGWTQTRLMDIAATDIRSRLKNHLYCVHLLPKEVLDYLTEFGLYFSL
jgi:nicotinate-nucleotide adenylyltransferase